MIRSIPTQRSFVRHSVRVCQTAKFWIFMIVQGCNELSPNGWKMQHAYQIILPPGPGEKLIASNRVQ